jgi:hypothetical protein
MKPETGRRLTNEEIRRGAHYLTLALGGFVNPEDYEASVLHAISAVDADSAFSVDPSGIETRQPDTPLV